MSTFYDNFQSVAAAWVINERITFHTQTGGMLAGLKFDKEGIYKIDGEDSLPLLQPWAVQFSESYFAGAPHKDISGANQSNQPVVEDLTLTYRVATSRKNGWFRRDPTNPLQKKGLLEWLSLIRDAVETGVDGDIDSRLLTGVTKPMLYSIGDTATTDLSFQCFFEIKLQVWPTHRAERSLTRPLPSA